MKPGRRKSNRIRLISSVPVLPRLIASIHRFSAWSRRAAVPLPIVGRQSSLQGHSLRGRLVKTWIATSPTFFALASLARRMAATDSGHDAQRHIQQAIERFQTAVIKQGRAASGDFFLPTNNAWIALVYSSNLDTAQVK